MISVVVIFLNAERFIAETIACVQAQTMRDWELVLVDDGSSDASTAIARAAAAADPARVRYVEHDGHVNLGLAATRNRGLAEARGDAILYLDSDDLLFPDALARMTGVLAAMPNVVAVAAPTLFWNWDPAFADEPDQMQDFRSWTGRCVAGPAFLAAMTIDETLHPANCGTLIRTERLRAAGGFSMGVPGTYEDTAMLTSLLIDARIALIGDALSAYRMHAASHCHTAEAEGDYAAGRANASRLRYLEWARGFVADRAPGEGALRRAIDETIARQRGRGGGIAELRRRLANLADVHRIRHRLAGRAAHAAPALAEIERFYRARGDIVEAERAARRRG